MKVAALANAGPQVSVMISRVNAFVPISIPLFTKTSRGCFFSLKRGCRVARLCLGMF